MLVTEIANTIVTSALNASVSFLLIVKFFTESPNRISTVQKNSANNNKIDNYLVWQIKTLPKGSYALG
jgi:hypothetical protein